MPKAAEVIPGVPDYSSVHEALDNTLFNTPKYDDWEAWSKYKLSDEKVTEFWEQGVITNVPILTVDQCDNILHEYRHFTDSQHEHPGKEMLYEFHANQTGDPDNVLVHVLGHWRLTRLFHDLVFHPKVVVPCSQLLEEGRERAVRFFHDQLFAKPAHHGGVVAWHQDYSYWTRTTPMRHVTVHIALEDQTEDNGTLKYIHGSHRWTRDGGKPLPVLDFNFKDMEGIKTILTDEELEHFKPKSSLLKKGQASFHHPLMVHGSYGNRSDKQRRAAVLNYIGDGVSSNTNDFLLKKFESQEPTVDNATTLPVATDRTKHDALFGGSDFPKGQKMQGQFYPLVFDPKWTVP